MLNCAPQSLSEPGLSEPDLFWTRWGSGLKATVCVLKAGVYCNFRFAHGDEVSTSSD